MQANSEPLPPALSYPSQARWVGPALLFLLVAFADWLFFNRSVGVSLTLFFCLLAMACLAGNGVRPTRRDMALGGAALILGLIPSIEWAGFLAFLFGVAGVAAFALAVTGNLIVPWPTALRRIMALALPNPIARLRGLTSASPKLPAAGFVRFLALLAAWAIPLALGIVFAALFSAANPVFRSWIGMLDPLWLFMHMQPWRYAFWLLVALFAAPFVAMPVFPAPRTATAGATQMGFPRPAQNLVLRSLIVVNLVFGLQTGLDLVHLWGGASLPAGVSPTGNAQRAAYILVVTALLAAALVLLAAPSAGEKGRVARLLLHLWIAQNVVLVLSAILRLALYVEAYSLTWLRLAAFIWMGLVVVGLVLIEWRIVFGKTAGWLVGANLVSLSLALYGCATLDLSAAIARYNVSHSYELAGKGVALDRCYLCSLGASALPEIERFLALRNEPAEGGPDWRLRECAARLRLTLREDSSDWRAWSFREHRLRRSIAATPTATGPDDAVDDPRGG